MIHTQHKENQHTIILIHGLYQNRFIMKILGKRLEKLNYNVLFFDYPTLTQSTTHNVEAFVSFLSTIQTPYSIIGHSLGCLVTYYTFEHLSQNESAATTIVLNTIKLPDSIIAITPPFQGARIVQYLAENHSGFLVGKAKEILSAHDQLPLQWQHDIPLGVIAGTDNHGPTTFLLERLMHVIPKDSLLSDGTVYLDEAMIEGAQDFITLPKSHTMILFDPNLPLLCDQFIRLGHFQGSD